MKFKIYLCLTLMILGLTGCKHDTVEERPVNISVEENDEEKNEITDMYVNNEHNAAFGTISEINEQNVIINGLFGETFIGDNSFAYDLKEGDSVCLEFNSFEKQGKDEYVVQLISLDYSDPEGELLSR